MLPVLTETLFARASRNSRPQAVIRRGAIATASRFAAAACEPSCGSPPRRWRGPAPCRRGFAAGHLSRAARPAPRLPPPPRRGPPVALGCRRVHCQHYWLVRAPQPPAVDAAPRCARRPAQQARRVNFSRRARRARQAGVAVVAVVAAVDTSRGGRACCRRRRTRAARRHARAIPADRRPCRRQSLRWGGAHASRSIARTRRCRAAGSGGGGASRRTRRSSPPP
eukprot:scaffold14984_cov69-Phaeocystis_antarctica.AAC.2